MKNKEIIIGGISTNELLLLVKQLYAGLKAGYSLLDALKLAYKQARGRMKQVLGDINEKVENGAYLHEALAKYPKYFSPIFINFVRTGELSAALEENLERLHSVLGKEVEFRQKIRSAMTYPMFVLVAVLGLGLSVSIFILPDLIPLFKSLNVELPISTRILLWFAAVFKDYGTSIGLGFIALVGLLFWLSHQKFAQPVMHKIALYMPVFGKLGRQITIARFSRAFAALLHSGVPLDQAISITASIISNYYYKASLLDSISLVRKGKNLSSALAQYPNLYDEFFIGILALGENTGSLEGSLSYISEYFENEADYTMKNLTISLEPMLLIFVGLLVGFVAISILGPIYSITGNLR